MHALWRLLLLAVLVGQRASAATQPIAWYKMDDPTAVGRDSISGNDCPTRNVIVDSTSALPAVAEGCEAAARFSTADQQFDPLPFTLTNSEMTMSWWVRLPAIQPHHAYMLVFRNHPNGGNRHIRIYKDPASDETDSAKTWIFIVKAGETLDCVPGSCSKVPIVFDKEPLEWAHIGWRIDTAGVWTISVNGNQVYKQFTVQVVPLTYAANHIGKHNNNEYRLDAHMRDFRLYDQALSDAEFGALNTSTLEFCAPAASTPRPGYQYKNRVTKVKATMSVPMTVEEFTEDAQLEYRETIAAVLGVTRSQVKIISVAAE
jgi:hypothetical protein